MEKTNNLPTGENQAARGQNAKRYGKVGAFVGFFAGLLSGKGWSAILPMTLMGGSAGALGGAAAGDKLNNVLDPIYDKLSSFLPSHKRAAAQEAANGAAQERETLSTEKGYESLTSLSSNDLQNMRAEVEANLRKAGADMDVNATPVQPGLPDEWISQNAAGKRANYEGPQIRQ